MSSNCGDDNAGREPSMRRLLCVATVLAFAGCASPRYLSWMPQRTAPCVLAPDAPLEEIVDALNRNVVPAWRSTDTRISARQAGMIPVSLSAVIAVEQPRNLRLIATNSFGSNEVDIGSNNERFWFWLRRAEPKCVLTASHEQLPRAQQRLQIPFQPDWLMETFGVFRLDASKWTLQRRSPNDPVVNLVSERTTPHGQAVRRVIAVDTCRAFVTQQALYDPSGKLIAQADFSDHRRDALTGAALPHRVSLDWPETGLHLNMQMGQIEINPMAVPNQTWQLPEYPDYPPFDLAQ